MSDNEKPTTDYGPAQGAGADALLTDDAPHHGMSASQYLATRFTSLKPPLTKLANPFKLLGMLTAHNWAFFGVAFFAWVCLCLYSFYPAQL